MLVRVLLASSIFMTHMFSNLTLHENGCFHPSFEKILKIFDIDSKKPFKDVLNQTQLLWFQKGKERWEFNNAYSHQEESILPLLSELKCLETVHAKKLSYDVAILHGSTMDSFRKRLQFLIDEFTRGVRFNHVYILTGDRPLIKDLESKKHLDDRTNPYLKIRSDFQPLDIEISTENEMIEYMLTQVDYPEDMQNISFSVFCVPHLKDEQGNYRRARTEDTIIHWKAEEHPKGEILAFSSQPYVGYQHKVLEYFFPNHLIETIGYQAPKNLPLSIHLDNLTKWLYWEYKIYTSKES